MHRNSVSSNRNTGQQAAQNRQKQTCFRRRFWARCAGRRAQTVATAWQMRAPPPTDYRRVWHSRRHRPFAAGAITVLPDKVDARVAGA